MGKDDPDLVDVVRRQLLAEGVDVRENTRATAVSGTAGAIKIDLSTPTGAETISASHLLVATGRKPAIERLNLDAAGHRPTPPASDHRPPQHAHQRASHLCHWGTSLAGRNLPTWPGIMRQWWSAKCCSACRQRPIPPPCLGSLTPTPELAQIGMTETAARDAGLEPRVELTNVGSNDRYITEGRRRRPRQIGLRRAREAAGRGDRSPRRW